MPTETHYKFTISSERLELEEGGFLEGRVQNTSNIIWGINHCVALRHFRDAAGRTIENFEHRALMIGEAQVARGEYVHFRFNFKDITFPENAASCSIDVVEEGVTWLEDIGAEPVRLSIRHKQHLDNIRNWHIFLDKLKKELPPPAITKLNILSVVLRRFDFFSNSNVKNLATLIALFRDSRPYKPLRPSSTTVLNALRSRRHYSSDPAALFIRYFIYWFGLPIEFSDPESIARIFNRFTKESGSLFLGTSVPMPSSVCEWLAKPALSDAIASAPLTRSMIATIGRDGPISLNPLDGGAEQIWNFATDVLITQNLTQSLTPHTVQRALARPSRVTVASDSFPHATGYMLKLYAENKDYRARFDISNDTGRCAFAFEILLLGIENEAQRFFLGTEIMTWITEPLADEIDMSAVEILLLATTGQPHTLAAELVERTSSLPVRHLIDWLPRRNAPPVQPTVRVLGDYQSNHGLSVNMRMSVDALKIIGMNIDIVDSKYDTLTAISNKEAQTLISTVPIDIFHLTLDAVPRLVARYADINRPNTYRIGFALWETSIMPEQHRIGLEMMDEIWAPTNYVADIYRQAGHPNVHVVGKGIDLPQPDTFDMKYLGIQPDKFVFLLSFDVDSWIDRKDPMAAVEAFQLAFQNDDSVRIVLKCHGLYDHPGDRTRQARRLQAAADSDKRIIIYTDTLPFRKYLGLIAASDATVSPHRSEGFGYLSAYSMLLGTPCVLTDYSGTRDFCDAETSFPVAASLEIIGLGDYVFDTINAEWAKIDTDALAKTMAQVRRDPTESKERTLRGQDFVARQYSMSALSSRYRNRISSINILN